MLGPIIDLCFLHRAHDLHDLVAGRVRHLVVLDARIEPQRAALLRQVVRKHVRLPVALEARRRGLARLRQRPLVGLLVGRAAELRVVDRERGRVGQADALNEQALQRRELGAELGGRHGRETRVRVVQQVPRRLRVRGHADRTLSGVRRNDWQVKLAAGQRVGAEVDIVVDDRERPAGGDVGADDLLRVLGPRRAVGAAALDALRWGGRSSDANTSTQHMRDES